MMTELSTISSVNMWRNVFARPLGFWGLLCLMLCFWTTFLGATTPTVQSLRLNSLLHFGTNVPDSFKPTSGGTNINGDLVSSTGGLQVLTMGYRSVDTGQFSTGQVAAIVNREAALDAAIEAAVIGKALFYPNPARQVDTAKLGYQLSKNMDIELQMYDMMANRIFKNTFPAGTNGGKSGYNKLTLNLDTFSGHFLSAGVYFYLIMHDGKVLAKGKVAVIP
jgi:hypothetical protein